MPPDHRKETQTAAVWSYLPFFRSGQNHLDRHSERGKETRQTEEDVGRQHEGMDRPGVRQVPEGSGERGKMEETSCEIICGAPTTLAVQGKDDDDDDEDRRGGFWSREFIYKRVNTWKGSRKSGVGAGLVACRDFHQGTVTVISKQDLLKTHPSTKC